MVCGSSQCAIHMICVKQSKKSQVPKVGRMMNAKKGRSLQYHDTSYWQIIYNGRPKFRFNVYLTL